MTQNQLAIESIASDLKRVALGLQRGSITMAKKFYEEASRRKSEVDLQKTPDYIKKILSQIELANLEGDRLRTAEELLMQSTLLQNFSSGQS